MKAKGSYKDINEGFTAAVTHFENIDKEDGSTTEIVEDDDSRIFSPLPPDFAFIGGLNSEPQLLDKALQRPNAK